MKTIEEIEAEVKWIQEHQNDDGVDAIESLLNLLDDTILVLHSALDELREE